MTTIKVLAAASALLSGLLCASACSPTSPTTSGGASSADGGARGGGPSGSTPGTSDGGAGGGACPPDGPLPDACFAVSISTEGDFACAVMKDGTARCFGDGSGGGLGRGDDGSPSHAALPVVSLANAASIVIDQDASCALLRDDSVDCWGTGGAGGNGLGTGAETETPTPTSLAGIASLARGSSIECAIATSGEVKCWQDVSYLPGSTASAPTPTTVEALAGAKKLALGDGHACGVYGDGAARCIGSNTSGQLGDGQGGDGSEANAQALVDVSGLSSGVVDVAAGSDHTCAVTTAGAVWCWGANDAGQLGDGTTTLRAAPVLVTGITDAVAVSATIDHTCALSKSGAVSCWGAGADGELGDGTTDDHLTPVATKGIAGATAISIHDNMSCAIRGDGRVLCWGGNANGQLGTYDDKDHLVATVVPF